MVTITCKRVGYTVGVIIMLIGIAAFIGNLVSFKIWGLFGSLSIIFIGLVVFGFTWHHNGGKFEDLRFCRNKHRSSNSSNVRYEGQPPPDPVTVISDPYNPNNNPTNNQTGDKVTIDVV